MQSIEEDQRFVIRCRHIEILGTGERVLGRRLGRGAQREATDGYGRCEGLGQAWEHHGSVFCQRWRFTLTRVTPSSRTVTVRRCSPSCG